MPTDDEDEALDAVIEETLRRAGRAYTNVGTLPAILSEADRRLSERLHRVVDKQGADVRFSDGAALLFRQQIRLTQSYMSKRLLGLTHDQAKAAIAQGTRDTVTLAKRLERRFSGIAQPLSLDTQGWLDKNVRGTGASLLRQHQTSVDRYGLRMISDFETQLRVGLLTGMSNAQIVARLVESGKHGGIHAGQLHKNEPAYFPKPTSYVKRRYWAERIVRTEVAFAHNAGSLASINEIRVTQFPDMGKKILAHFDNRTALDSVAVHGQVRKVDELFMDGAGRQYLHPPARPNDRETIIPWRLGWKELPVTKTEDPKEAAAQTALTPPAQPKGPEASPNVSLMDDILGMNNRVRARRDLPAMPPMTRPAPVAPPVARPVAPVAPAAPVATQPALVQTPEQQAATQRRLARQQERIDRDQARVVNERRQAALAAKEAEQERQKEALAETRRRQATKREQVRAEVKARKEAASPKPKTTRRKKEAIPGFMTPAEAMKAYEAGQHRVHPSDLKKIFGKTQVPGPDWWKQTFKPPKGYEVGTGSFFSTPTGITWSSSIRDSKGASVGNIERTFSRDENGKLVVKHDLLKLHEPEKHESVGGSILAQSHKVYDKIGVYKIKLSTAWDGKVVWAHMGFSWEGEYEQRRMNRGFAEYLEGFRRVPRKEAEAIAATMKEPRDILNFELNAPEQKPERPHKQHIHTWEVGRQFLKSSSGWSGELKRDDSNEGFKIYKSKVEAAEKRLREKGRWAD